MWGPIRKLGDIATRVESWLALGTLIVQTGVFTWLGYQWDALASQGWAAVVFVAVLCAAILTLAIGVIFLAIAEFRKGHSPQGNLNAPIQNQPAGRDNLMVIANQRFSKCPIKLDGNRFINCEFEGVFVTWDGGPYSLEGCKIDATRVDAFQTNNPAIAQQMRLFGALGLLHPKGTKAMGLPIEPEDEAIIESHKMFRSAERSHSPDVAPNTTASSAALRLMFRKDQDPLELSKTNIWRWFAYSSVGISRDSGERHILGTQIILTFDQEIPACYKRLSCNRDDVHMQSLDYTSRTAVVSVDGDLSDAVLELVFSENPV